MNVPPFSPPPPPDARIALERRRGPITRTMSRRLSQFRRMSSSFTNLNKYKREQRQKRVHASTQVEQRKRKRVQRENVPSNRHHPDTPQAKKKRRRSKEGPTSPRARLLAHSAMSDRPISMSFNASEMKEIQELLKDEEFKPATASIFDSSPTSPKRRNTLSLRIKRPRIVKDVRNIFRHEEKEQPKPVKKTGKLFGVPLAQVMANQHDEFPELDTPVFVHDAINYLTTHGIKEGIFRLSATASAVEKLKTELDDGVTIRAAKAKTSHASNSGADDEAIGSSAGNVNGSKGNVDFYSINNFVLTSCLLKLFLRSLPQPILTFQFHDQFLAALDAEGGDHDLEAIKETLKQLPPHNKAVIESVMELCHLVCSHKAVTKMTASNLSICMGPNLLWPQGMSVEYESYNLLVKVLIDNYHFFFDKALPEVTPQQHDSAVENEEDGEALIQSETEAFLKGESTATTEDQAVPLPQDNNKEEDEMLEGDVVEEEELED